MVGPLPISVFLGRISAITSKITMESIRNMTLMVRQLAHSEHGLPLEIYAFTNDVQWAEYETVQSDIFDHLFAVAPEFGLRVFQNPSGADLRNIVEESSNKALIGERSN